MNKILAIILVLAGGWIVYLGYEKGDSIAGKTKSSIAGFKNEIDGGTRIPDHVWYYVGGGALALIGAGVALRKS